MPVLKYKINDSDRAGISTIVVKCNFVEGHQMSFNVVKMNWEEYLKTRETNTGRFIQEIFTYLTPEQREILITGMCDKCWKELFSSE